MTNATLGANAPAMPARRAVLCSIAAAGAAFAAPSVAKAVNLEADPIFPAIERHKASRERFGDAINLTDEILACREGRLITEADEHAYEVASDAEAADFLAVISTPPQTKAGIRAVLQHISEGTLYEELPDGGIADLFAALLRSPAIAGA